VLPRFDTKMSRNKRIILPGEDDSPRAQDAIPKDAISLTDAFWLVFGVILNHPELQPELDEGWSEALRRSEQVELERLGPQNKRFSEHTGKQANVILRLALQGRALVACTRDPHTGDILQLSSDGWLDWAGDIPPLIATDHIIAGDDECAGPNGTFIHGALRPVFFIRNDFETWLKKVFIVGAPKIGDLRENSGLQTSDHFLKHRREAVKQALKAIWGLDGPPPGVMETIRNRQVNKWLAENGRASVSEATIRRALSEMRAERT